MTEVEKLIARLRKLANESRQSLLNPGVCVRECVAAGQRLADECTVPNITTLLDTIEALQAEVERLKSVFVTPMKDTLIVKMSIGDSHIERLYTQTQRLNWHPTFSQFLGIEAQRMWRELEAHHNIKGAP